MEKISSVKVQGGHAKIVAGVIGASALLVLIMAIFTLGGWSLVGALAIVACLGLALLTVRTIRAEIGLDGDLVILRLWPFRSVSVPSTQITNIQPSRDSSVAEGFGYRVLGGKRRGLLVGGPCLEIMTDAVVWVVSCKEPIQIAKTITQETNGDNFHEISS